MLKTFILSDEQVNSYGFSVDLSKLKLDRFRSNPVMLYNHGQLVGRWSNIRVEEGKLMADPEFMDAENEEEALKVKSRVEKGFVKGASLGIHILKVNREKGKAPSVEAEVFECSVCDIPSNAGAIVLYDDKGARLEGKALGLALESLSELEILPTDMKLNAKTYEALSLDSSADQSAVDAAIQQLAADNARMKTELEQAGQAKIDSLIDLNKDRIPADKMDSIKELAKTNYDLAKSTIEMFPKKEKLAGKEQLSGNSGSDSEDRDSWSFKDWREKDTAGLLAIKSKDPERYAEIIKK